MNNDKSQLVDIPSFFGGWRVHQQFDELIALLIDLDHNVRLLTCGCMAMYVMFSAFYHLPQSINAICEQCNSSSETLLS